MPNIQLIKLDWSDGTPETWPKGADVDPTPKNGEVNYHFKLPLDSIKYSLYKKKCGQFLSQFSREEGLPADTEIELSELPQGYALFEHRKGSRTDVYLWGHPTGRKFRSPAEFNPHLQWMALNTTHQANTDDTCICVCCKQSGGARNSTIDRTPGGPMSAKKEKKNFAVQERREELEPDAPAYRVAELVWARAPQGGSEEWVPAVVVKRHKGEKSLDAKYDVKDIGSKGIRPNLPHSDVLPWLARAVEGPEAQKSTAVKTAQQICKTWSLISSYTPDVSSGRDPRAGKYYNGMFIGPERIWRNEPVRLKSDPEAGEEAEDEIMLISAFLRSEADTTVTLLGDIYTFHTFKDDEDGAANHDLPPGMVITDRMRTYAADRGYWKPKFGPEYESNLELDEIAGRWYEDWVFPSEPKITLGSVEVSRWVTNRAEGMGSESWDGEGAVAATPGASGGVGTPTPAGRIGNGASPLARKVLDSDGSAKRPLEIDSAVGSEEPAAKVPRSDGQTDATQSSDKI
ncbi:hypothetical protein SAICODRAFT_152317 [Saitoella complicata NRRL Y-17804]|uniref:uncharacterized protein n=1 Tax=Saitoella complicata (strain BCRC 22490 / CBS 7301 / JCM 7358 / NBRC 10748 / NRRL Y-17804) TaxID=698492 RepID=UPI00086754B2|nr:uncharacterized protein SAICODRAFT_152317 [Saitoella complicata NRRL Y-17804]ODQ55820.1 hypothetical protein SAICODRAFT_152317 [Saitoella complicata NRRL Y-17804]